MDWFTKYLKREMLENWEMRRYHNIDPFLDDDEIDYDKYRTIPSDSTETIYVGNTTTTVETK